MEFGNKNVRVRMEDDRISSLPDEIIHHILSFSDTKSAVQTSVLSSRWKLIWTTLTYLKLCSDAFRILPKFFKFVNRVLSLRNHQTEVSSLDLRFRGPANQKIVQKIASYVVSHNVQKVNIFASELKGNGDRELPLYFFSSQSLRHLSIKAPLVWNRVFPLPQSTWDSPALTSVELTNVWLCPGNTTCLDLFSTCVNLMNLTLTHCRADQLKCMKILCPRLVCLSISRCWPSTYEILAPNLSSFHYYGSYPLILSTGGLNSLEKVNLCTGVSGSVYSNEEMQRIAHEFMNMLCELRHAKVVILHGQVIEFLSDVLNFLEHQPSPFCNLKCLRIEGLERPEKQRRGKRAKSDMTDQVITYLLNSSPTATVSKEFRKEKLNDPIGKLPKEERNSPSKQEGILANNHGKDSHGRMSCVGDSPTESMAFGKASTSEILAAVRAEFEAKMESQKMSMEAEFSRRLEAQQAEFSKRLEAQQAEFFSRHLNEMEAFQRNLMQQLQASSSIELQPL